MDSFRIAGVQMDIAFADKQANLRAMQEQFRHAVSLGARLVIFPECALTGYCFSNQTQALELAEVAEGAAAKAMSSLANELHAVAVYGYLERDGQRFFNSLAMVGPKGTIAGYRKVHLPFLGVDRFATPGDLPLEVVELNSNHLADLEREVRIGMLICYDCSFPETARVLALQGADLVVLPTNWPRGADGTANHIINARSIENHIYFAAVDRVGKENGFEFIGTSRICDPKGNDLAVADRSSSEILVADVVPEIARNKSTINVPGEYELHRLADRRPEFYQAIAERRVH